MTQPRFDEVVHPPNHLRLLAMLHAVPEVEFSTLRDALGSSDSSTSKYLKVLTEAGYVSTSKPPTVGRRRTWVHLTADGRRAFLGHLAEIERLGRLTTADVAATSS